MYIITVITTTVNIVHRNKIQCDLFASRSYQCVLRVTRHTHTHTHTHIHTHTHTRHQQDGLSLDLNYIHVSLHLPPSHIYIYNLHFYLLMFVFSLLYSFGSFLPSLPDTRVVHIAPKSSVPMPLLYVWAGLYVRPAQAAGVGWLYCREALRWQGTPQEGTDPRVCAAINAQIPSFRSGLFYFVYYFCYCFLLN